MKSIWSKQIERIAAEFRKACQSECYGRRDCGSSAACHGLLRELLGEELWSVLRGLARGVWITKIILVRHGDDVDQLAVVVVDVEGSGQEAAAIEMLDAWNAGGYQCVR